jgi:hypothetical protein
LALLSRPALAAQQPLASQAAESCHTWQNARVLTGVSGYVGAAAWIMLFDANVAPANGAVNPIAWAYVSTAGSWSIWYDGNPAQFLNGVTVCASSTGPLTFTAYSTNTVFSAQVQ